MCAFDELQFYHVLLITVNETHIELKINGGVAQEDEGNECSSEYGEASVILHPATVGATANHDGRVDLPHEY